MQIHIAKLELQELASSVVKIVKFFRLEEDINTVSIDSYKKYQTYGRCEPILNNSLAFNIYIADDYGSSNSSFIECLVHELSHAKHFLYEYQTFDENNFLQIENNFNHLDVIKLLREYIAERSAITFMQEQNITRDSTIIPKDNSVSQIAYTIALEHANNRHFMVHPSVSEDGVKLLDEFYELIMNNIEISFSQYQLKLSELSNEISL